MALRTALRWAGIQSGVRVALGFVSAKVSALYLGPEGMALVGQLGGVIQLAQGSIGNGAHTAMVTLTASRRENAQGLAHLWATGLRLALGLAILVAVAGALAAEPLSAWLLSHAVYWPAIACAAIAIAFAVADTTLTGILNGIGRIDVIGKAAITSTVLEVSVFATLAYLFGLWGGLFGAAAIYAVRLAVDSAFAFGSRAIAPSRLMARVDGALARDILRFYPMLLVQSVATPLAQILVRNAIMGAQGLEQTGYLQAVWRLSDMYVGVLITALGLYFMAHFSALSGEWERGASLRRTVGQMVAITSMAAITIYLLRDLIIRIVLSPKFMPMADLLPYHLLGDVFKMSAYPMQMALVVRRRSRTYMAVSAGAPAAFVVLTHVMLSSQGLQAAPIAYAVSYFGQLVILVLAWRTTLMVRSPSEK
jgi:PST family polysaccharide transporter